MADPQVPANAVQEAQAILQNPAPDEAQALPAPAQAPAQQAQAPAQANEVSLEVCETLFSLSFATCFVLVLELLFYFGSTLLSCFVPALLLRLPLFLLVLRAKHPVIYLYLRCPAVNVFAPLWALRAIFGLVYCSPCFLTYALFSRGLCGQFLFQMLFALLLTICPLSGLCGLYFDLACFSPCS